MSSLRKTGFALAAALGIIIAHPAAAQVIYRDNFSTGTAGSINGQKPSTDPSNAAYTVLSSDNYSGGVNGTSDVTETGGAGPATFALSSITPAMVEAFLPYVVTSNGPAVTLSATVSMPADTSWFTLGFAANNNNGPFGTGPGPWLLVRGASTGTDNYELRTAQTFANATAAQGTIANLTTTFTFSETLTPTTGGGGVLTASYNGTQFLNYTLTSLPTINDVFFGTYVDSSGTKAGRTISNFSLTAAPEPSQTAAFGLGVLGLSALAFKARRRSSLGA